MRRHGRGRLGRSACAGSLGPESQSQRAPPLPRRRAAAVCASAPRAHLADCHQVVRMAPYELENGRQVALCDAARAAVGGALCVQRLHGVQARAGREQRVGRG